MVPQLLNVLMALNSSRISAKRLKRRQRSQLGYNSGSHTERDSMRILNCTISRQLTSEAIRYQIGSRDLASGMSLSGRLANRLASITSTVSAGG